MDIDIDHEFIAWFATGFADVPNGAGLGLILRLQTSTFSGEGLPVAFLLRSLYSLVGIDAAKL